MIKYGDCMPAPFETIFHFIDDWRRTQVPNYFSLFYFGGACRWATGKAKPRNSLCYAGFSPAISNLGNIQIQWPRRGYTFMYTTCVVVRGSFLIYSSLDGGGALPTKTPAVRIFW